MCFDIFLLVECDKYVLSLEVDPSFVKLQNTNELPIFILSEMFSIVILELFSTKIVTMSSRTVVRWCHRVFCKKTRQFYKHIRKVCVCQKAKGYVFESFEDRRNTRQDLISYINFKNKHNIIRQGISRQYKWIFLGQEDVVHVSKLASSRKFPLDTSNSNTKARP